MAGMDFMRSLSFGLFVMLLSSHLCAEEISAIPNAGEILDLDADHGVEVEGSKVIAWRNRIAWRARDFKPTREDGKPALRKDVPALKGHSVIVFEKQELVNDDEDAFDHLTTGTGYTWITVLAPHKQRPQLQDVNSFFGNLRNGQNFEGFWAGFNDDNSVWIGSRNSTSFGRWDKNNPKVQGPKLEENRFYIIAGRMSAGTGEAEIELFVNNAEALAKQPFPVNVVANASKMAIGQERDAREHPGRESFVGEIARMLMWERPLSNEELKVTIGALDHYYGIEGGLAK